MKLLSIILLLFTSTVYSQVQFNATVNTTNAAIGERIRLTVTTNANGQVSLPQLPHFRVQGPQTSQSSSYSSVNGKVTQSVKINYIYYLMAEKTGEFVVGAAILKYKGQVYETDPITITIGKSSDGASRLPTENENLYGRIELSKRSVYAGEPITASYKLYSRYNSLQMQDADYPMTNGLWKEEIKAPKDGWPSQQKRISGVVYNVFTIKKDVLIAQKSGEIKIPAFSMDLLQGRSFFSNGKNMSVKSNSVTLNVKSPPNPPANYSGLVGDFTITSEISTTEVEIDDAIDYKIKINGKGNLKSLDDLPIEFPADFEQYDPEISENIKFSSVGANGSKEFNYLLIPRSGGEYPIPTFEIAYFNPKTEKYQTLKSQGYTIAVTGGNSASTTTTPGLRNQQDVAELNKGIRHIRKETTLININGLLHGSAKFWTYLSVPFLSFLFVLFWTKKSKRNPADETDVKQKNAGKIANKFLSNAKLALDKNDSNAFHEALLSGLFNYLDNKTGLKLSELNDSTIASTLKENRVSETTINKVQQLKQTCEMAKYAPSNVDSNSGLYETSVQLIEKLENEITL